MSTILSSLSDPIKVKKEKCSSTKELWENLQNLHSKGLLPITSDLEDDGQEHKDNHEPKKAAENKIEDTKSKENLEDEENSQVKNEVLNGDLVGALKK